MQPTTEHRATDGEPAVWPAHSEHPRRPAPLLSRKQSRTVAAVAVYGRPSQPDLAALERQRRHAATGRVGS